MPPEASAAVPHRVDPRRIDVTDKLTWLARVGLVARGVVYGVIGVLAIKLAIGAGGRAESQRGAMETIARQPAGVVLLIVLAVGLVAYAVWRGVLAIIGSKGEDDHELLHRSSAGASAVVYLALCVTAIKILTGAHTSGGTSQAKHATAGVLGWPGGTALVTVAGAVLVVVGLYQGYRGIATKFLKESRTAEMSEPLRRAFTGLGVFGHIARMVVFVLVGYGLIKAALDYKPSNAIGLDGALRHLAQASYGPLLLGIVAAGLLGFGLYSIADAKYHRPR